MKKSVVKETFVNEVFLVEVLEKIGAYSHNLELKLSPPLD